jgi:hypothetical protein
MNRLLKDATFIKTLVQTEMPSGHAAAQTVAEQPVNTKQDRKHFVHCTNCNASRNDLDGETS